MKGRLRKIPGIHCVGFTDPKSTLRLATPHLRKTSFIWRYGFGERKIQELAVEALGTGIVVAHRLATGYLTYLVNWVRH